MNDARLRLDGAFISVLRSYQDHARERGLSFNLTDEEFKEITQQDCHYCGVKPSRTFTRQGKRCRRGSSFTYNGVDRKNNTLGYSTENCVPCCSQCNSAKSTTPYQDFINWIHAAHHNLTRTQK